MKPSVARLLWTGCCILTPVDGFVSSGTLSSLSSKGRHADIAPGANPDAKSSDDGSGMTMGLRSSSKKAWRRLRGGKERSDAELKKGIANFYDKSSSIWEDIWGEHMHHGYYVQGMKPKTIEDHRAAQRFMINRSLEWAGVEEGANAPKTGVDIGCGVGGSSRHITRRYGTSMAGITLSPVQRNKAQALSEAQDMGDKCTFQVADALDTPFEDDSFDLVWSMESGEHMPHKPKFVSELVRICAPGGRILVVTWCHRDLKEGETELTRKEKKLLDKINKAYFLPKWCSLDDYEQYFKAEGLKDIRRADWTDNVQRFWPAIIRTSFSIKGIVGLIKSGPVTLRGAVAMVYMIRGFQTGLVKFVLISGKKA